MAIPNFQFNVNYPNIKDKTMSDTFWETVTPYENLKSEQLNRDYKRQQMELNLLEASRAEERLGMDREKLAMDQKREGREEKRFGREEAKWERDEKLRQAVIGAAQSAGNDPMQAMVNVSKVVMASGNPELAMQFREAATKFADSFPDPAQRAQAKGILGITTTPELERARGIVYKGGLAIDPYSGEAVPDPLEEKKLAVDQQRIAASREAHADVVGTRNKETVLRHANAAFSDIERRVSAVETYRVRANSVRSGGGNMWSSILANMQQNREDTSGAPADPTAGAQWLDDRANRIEQEIPTMIQQAGRDFGDVAEEAMFDHPTLNNYRQHLRGSPMTPKPQPWAPSPGSIGNEVSVGKVTPGASIQPPVPGSDESKKAKLRKAGVVTTVKQAQEDVQLSDEAKRRQERDKQKMGRW